MFGLLSLRRLRWLGHVIRMQDGRIPKDILYGELETSTRPTGRPHLCFKDVCKKDIKPSSITLADLESTVADRDSWRLNVKSSVRLNEEKRLAEWEDKRRR